MHVKQIREVIDDGRTDEAHDLLDQLLALGPSNTEALKLRAMLYGQQGRFTDEFRVWDSIADIDNEDPDVINYFQLRHLEEREHFYFTDDLPEGGRRYMAYPRTLLSTTTYALLGCLAFLVYSRLAQQHPVLEETFYLLSAFSVTVLIPWVFTISAWVKAIKWVIIDQTSIEFATRFKKVKLNWKDVEKTYLASSSSEDGDFLFLVFIPKAESDQKIVEIDLSTHSSSIRARSYFVREISAFVGAPEFITIEELDFADKKVLSY